MRNLSTIFKLCQLMTTRKYTYFLIVCLIRLVLILFTYPLTIEKSFSVVKIVKNRLV